MRLGRGVQSRLSYLLNDYLPPVVRDARWFIKWPIRWVFGDHAALVMDFKELAYKMTDEEIVDVYRELGPYGLTLGSDLNRKCTERILHDAVGPSLLDVGCGDGALAARLSHTLRVTACDIVVRSEVVERYPSISFCEAGVERLPFSDREFDTVVCTHTLEHVRDLPRAVAELRRVAKRRVIVVVPKERPYRYTFNLHLHFFPYPHMLLGALGKPAWHRALCETVGGDLYYREDIDSRT